MPIQNALTVDVEDYYHVSGFERDIQREDWGSYPSRVVQNTRRILALLNGTHVKATFFVLGWVADHYPYLVSEIDAAGHEIGSHSYWHHLVYRQSPCEFRDDLCRSRDLLQDITGKSVTAYRAPSFSITSESLWALDILAQEGFQVDASIFPIYHHRCGIPGAPCHPFIHETLSGNITIFPGSVVRIGKVNLPIAGGGYFRLLPYWFTNRLLRHINKRLGQPFVFYIHPWEVDPEQPRLKVSTRVMRFRHYVNLSTTKAKVQRLLTHFSFNRLNCILNQTVRIGGADVTDYSLPQNYLRTKGALHEVNTCVVDQ
jgi:polysaccharide deacetylase family protein (PEP-CTERM system associated)